MLAGGRLGRRPELAWFYPFNFVFMKYFLFLTALALSPLASQAQTPTTGGPVPQAPDPTAVPLDGGASLLLAGSVAYGLKRLRTRKR